MTMQRIAPNGDALRRVAGAARQGLSHRRVARVVLACAWALCAIANAPGFFSPFAKSPLRAASRKTQVPRHLMWKALVPQQLVEQPSRLAPGAISLTKPRMERLLDDIKAHVTFPYRFLRLTSITKQVVAEQKQRRKSMKSSSSSGDKETSLGAGEQLKGMIPGFMKSHVVARTKPEDYRQLLNNSINVIFDSITDPFQFKTYHKAVRGPEFDYYQWGNDFFKGLVKYRHSRVEGLEVVEEIKAKTAAGDNVVLLANHQTEADPYVLSILLALYGHEDLAQRIVFVAGHKVTTDPMAIPFSMGCNLLTIFSKKYLDEFDEARHEEAATHNRETVSEMSRLLSEGGKILWVAPSGGRDRKSAETGKFVPAKFDADSVGLFRLLAKKAEKFGKKTHFHPLAMWTNGLVPPPDGASAKLGEARSAVRAPVGLYFGQEMVPDGKGKTFGADAERTVMGIYDELDYLMEHP